MSNKSKLFIGFDLEKNEKKRMGAAGDTVYNVVMTVNPPFLAIYR